MEKEGREGGCVKMCTVQIAADTERRSQIYCFLCLFIDRANMRDSLNSRYRCLDQSSG